MAATGASAHTATKGVFARAVDQRQVLVSAPWQHARLFAALLVAGGFGSLVVMVLRDPDAADWRPSRRLAWSLSLLAATMLLARGIYLGRPVTSRHAAIAVAMLLAGLGGHLLGGAVVGGLLVAGAGMALMWPLPSRAGPGDPLEVWPMICATQRDPLAAFAMHSAKSWFFNDDRSAALAYRTRLGFAVVSADPVGDPSVHGALVRDFAALCHRLGWRIMVLNCSERSVQRWCDASVIAAPLITAPVGRDVVVDVAGFTMTGRKFRNLRQAVARTNNRGITTEVVAEQDLTDPLKAELTEVLHGCRGGGRERGFSMMLDGVLTGRYPGVLLIIGRDRRGTVQAFHRYVCSGGGADVSLDLPWRRPGAPNGIDERLTVDMIGWCKEHGGHRLSLAFAAFPELFDARQRSAAQHVYYRLIRLGEPLIRLEALYKYLRKFRSLDQRRYVVFSARHLFAALVVLLSLEFVPSRSR